MASRLSSLLVRDGLVGVKRMEHAFQRQVIYGGCLDTILLEMNLVPEERLLQYLSLATGLPPATREETDVFDAQAVTECPVEAARGYRVVPLCVEEGALRVLVHDPVDLSLLEELANDIELPVQPLVAPEYRFHLVFARMFGGVPNARFVTLGKRAEEAQPSSPVGKARSVIIEESAPAAVETEISEDHVVVDVGVPPPQVSGQSVRSQEIAVQSLAQRVDESAERQLQDVEDDRERLGAAPTEPLAETPSGRTVRRHARETILGVGLPGADFFLPKKRSTEEMIAWDTVSARTGGEIEVAGEVAVRGDAPTDPAIPLQKLRDAPPAPVVEDVREEAVTDPVIPAQKAPAESPEPDGADGADAAQPEAERVITAPMGSRNAPDGSDKIIRPPPRPRLVGGDLVSDPLTAAEARAALEAADDRDLIFGILLRAVRQHAWYAGLLTIQGGSAIGRIAISGDEVDRDEIGSVLLPLDAPSPFQAVVRSASPHIGAIATGQPEIDDMIRRMGGGLPPVALLLPVALRNRVVAMIVGHNGDQGVDVGVMAHLLPLAGMAADAILRLIVKAKARAKAAALAKTLQEDEETTSRFHKRPQGLRGKPAAGPAADDRREPPQPVAEEPPPPVAEEPPPPMAEEPAAPEPTESPGGDDADESDDAALPLPPPPELAPDPATSSAITAAPDLGAGDEPDDGEQVISMVADEPESIDDLLDAIEAGEAGDEAKEEALTRIDEVLEALASRFPGRLTVDRYELGGRTLAAAQHGPLLAFVSELGDEVTALLVDKMRDEEREVRYYATLCIAENRPHSAIGALVERLFDSDYGTRSAAIDALGRYPTDELEQGLLRARQAVHSDDPARIQAAANALARLADVSAIPDLLDACGRGGKGAEHARRALVQLTKQNFGSSNRKWRAWWKKNRDRSRIEWLIDGLSSKEETLRRSSVEELRKLTGEYFDFQYDLPKRDREPARKRWADWWQATGRTRFHRS